MTEHSGRFGKFGFWLIRPSFRPATDRARQRSAGFSHAKGAAHNQIAGNLDRLLNARLKRYAPSLISIQRAGLELGGGDHKPQADVVFIDADYAASQRFAEKTYLLAEGFRKTMRSSSPLPTGRGSP